MLQIKFEFGFDPSDFHEVTAHERRKIFWIVSFLHFCSLLALQSQIITNQNLVLLCLNYFWLNIPPVGDLVLLAILLECLLNCILFYIIMSLCRFFITLPHRV
jgi:hypothetical protein